MATLSYNYYHSRSTTVVNPTCKALIVIRCLLLFSANTFTLVKKFGEFSSQLIVNATPWVDSFFMMSGLLVSYIGVNEFAKPRQQHLSGFKGVWMYTCKIIMAYVHRYLR